MTVDEVPIDDETALLLRYRPWLRSVAGRFPQMMPSRTEDLAQEGWIAMWRGVQAVREKSPDDRPANVDLYLKRCAINRMNNVFTSWKRQSRDVYKTTLVDFAAAYDDDAWASYLASVALATDLGELEWAYHHGEILQAVNRLPRSQRAYVLRRFWHNWAPTALDIYFTNPKETWRSARNNLRRELAHLAEDKDTVMT